MTINGWMESLPWKIILTVLFLFCVTSFFFWHCSRYPTVLQTLHYIQYVKFIKVFNTDNKCEKNREILQFFHFQVKFDSFKFIQNSRCQEFLEMDENSPFSFHRPQVLFEIEKISVDSVHFLLFVFYCILKP